MTDDLLERHNDASHQARYGVWSAWGTVDPYVIAPIVNPAFMGGTRWPGLRQAHLVVRKDDAALLASDGLADPAEWSDGDPTNGLGVEAYAITDDKIGGEGDGEVMAVGWSWLGTMVRNVSNTLSPWSRRGPSFPRRLDSHDWLVTDRPGRPRPPGTLAPW
jgi:hypothetical protein